MMIPGAGVDLTDLPLRENLRGKSPYGAPQLDVPVRLNTNEAAEPPPAEFVTAMSEAMADIAWNRYPDRAATDLREAIAAMEGVDPARVF
ncbi:MAG TPA: hypothetical protein PK594_08135, partial [Mycobacterium sp.]|nr:hypothetical protein [Mycobacterium sp.]